jgi:hypothetical protein
MSRTYRDLSPLPSPRPPAPPPVAAVRLLRLCRNCGEVFHPTGPHVAYCHPCQLPAERRAYRRTDRKVSA